MLPSEQRRQIGARLAALRDAYNITQAKLAEALDISPYQLSRWESGHHEPDLSTLIEIAREYKVPISWILLGLHAENFDRLVEAYLQLHHARLFRDGASG